MNELDELIGLSISAVAAAEMDAFLWEKSHEITRLVRKAEAGKIDPASALAEAKAIYKKMEEEARPFFW